MAAPTPADLALGIPAGANIVQRIAAPGGGEYIMDDQGGLYTTGNAKFQGTYQGESAATRNDPNRRFVGLELGPNGYTQVSNTGERYRYGAEPNANTLATDPAFLAFLRTSGLGLETAAQDVGRRRAAIENALATNVSDIGYNAGQAQKRTAGGMEARGILRSTDTANAQNEVERNRAIAESNARTNAANQIGGLYSDLASKVAGVQNSAAERGLSTGQTQDMNNSIDSLKQKYPDYFAGQTGSM